MKQQTTAATALSAARLTMQMSTLPQPGPNTALSALCIDIAFFYPCPFHSLMPAQLDAWPPAGSQRIDRCNYMYMYMYIYIYLDYVQGWQR